MDVFKAIVELLVGLVVFVTGMNLMSSGLKKSAGVGIKKLFKKLQNNRFACAGIGAVVTAIIQSSSATSVMVIGFINASIMGIMQGLSIILGAYIGTTVTGLLVSLSSFTFAPFLMLTAFIGFILSFLKNPKVKNISEILIGFGILFFGLEAMKGAFSDPSISSGILTLFENVSFPLLLVFIGAVFTAITQSSSATNGIVIVMVASNPSLLGSGLFLVLGATIGAVMPTILATIGGNINAKRTAFLALTIRSISALLGMAIVWIFQQPIVDLLNLLHSPGLAIALFTIIYNIIAVSLTLPFVKQLEKLSIKIIKDNKADRKKKALKFIDDRFLNTPSIAMMQVKREIYHMYDLALKNYKIGYSMMLDHDFSREKELIDREDKIDYINAAITDYLIKLSNNVDIDDEKLIGGYFHVINDIERIGDHAYNFYKSSKEMVDDDLLFSDVAKDELNEFNKTILDMFDLSKTVFRWGDKNDLSKLHDLENKTDDLKIKLNAAHYDRLTKNQCQVELSPFYSTFISELERIGDHLTNIGYTVLNPTGNDE